MLQQTNRLPREVLWSPALELFIRQWRCGTEGKGFVVRSVRFVVGLDDPRSLFQ